MNDMRDHMPPYLDGAPDMESPETLAEEAEAREADALSEPQKWTYTHVFKSPFTWAGRTYERLTFDWSTLTGADSLEIESEMLRRGVTLVVPEYSGAYLTGMAARACTERDERGRRLVTDAAVRALPLGDFQIICRRARTFLQQAAR